MLECLRHLKQILALVTHHSHNCSTEEGIHGAKVSTPDFRGHNGQWHPKADPTQSPLSVEIPRDCPGL